MATSPGFATTGATRTPARTSAAEACAREEVSADRSRRNQNETALHHHLAKRETEYDTPREDESESDHGYAWRGVRVRQVHRLRRARSEERQPRHRQLVRGDGEGRVLRALRRGGTSRGPRRYRYSESPGCDLRRELRGRNYVQGV